MGRIKFKEFQWLLWGLFIATSSDFVEADANPDISPFQPPIDPRPRLSTTQQQQILNDVQQHQRRFNFAKYRVDPLKQQFQQPQQQQQPQPQPQQSDRPFFQTAQSQYQFPRQNFAPTGLNPFSAFQTSDLPLINFRNSPDELNFFNDPTATLQLQSYYEKQRELELLRKQREQLILEQQELRRQQELLRLQQLRALTSTTPKPTTTTTTTTQQPITQSPALLASPSSRRITPAESEIFLKAIANHQKKFTTTAKPVTPRPEVTTHRPRQERIQEDQFTQDIPRELLSLIQAQNPQLLGGGKNKPQIKIIYQTEKPATQRATLKTKSLEKDLLLKQLKLALAENSEAEIEKNVTTRDLVLPNGKKLQVIQAPNGLSSIIPNEGSSQFQTVTQALDTKTASTTSAPTTGKSASTILEELAKGVLPPGADFEVLKHKDDGKLEEVGKVPIQNSEKKVTFVVLEEQSDGSYKVQGVKGNNGKDNSSDVQTIVEKIKNGELKLPPSSKSPISDDKTPITTVTKPTTTTTTTPTTTTTTVEPTTYKPSTTAEPTTVKPTTIRPTTIRPTINIRTTTVKYTDAEIPNVTKYHNNELTRDYSPYAAVTSNSVISTDNYVTSASTPSANIYNSISSFIPSSQRPTTAANYRIGSSPIVIAQKNHFIPTMAPVNEIITTPSSTFLPHSSSYVHFSTNLGNPSTTATPRPVTSTIGSINSVASENLIIDDFHQGRNTINFDNTINQFNSGETIANLLKREGLFAMAKYLRQSGLDKVLNDTGPYTIFIPTDKAFRALLVQLGGPEKAEQKFKENPRLLSGLLLHHVIPGDFRTESLQEEMTGVSLAGTQLRVNVYDMHDHEWNDVKVTTINGARIAPNKRDIEIPQGIAHAVDRVMFPLPVGDLMQTLAADREQRFGIFLRILQAAGLEEILTGTKTYTIFAPTDAAFAATAAQTGQPVWSETNGPEAAKTIASKHIMPTTLYSAGMRYYHQKDTLRPQFTLRIQKNGGRVRVNEAQVVTPNIPATNGVIQAIDGVLQ